MKQLLGMARDKKQKQPLRQPTSSLLIHKNNTHAQYAPPIESEEQGAYEISQQELFAFAEFLGIQLPEEEDLMWIAEEGLTAQLPAGWETDQTTQDGEVIYVNIKTGERTYEHPCDEYYKQLVLQQRRKKGGSKVGMKKAVMPVGPQHSKPLTNPSNLLQSPMVVSLQKQAPVDPLVKMQQQKEVKKLQQQKKRQLDERKKDVMDKNQRRKEQLLQDLKKKQEQAARRYSEESRREQQKQTKKMSQKQQGIQESINRQLINYQAGLKHTLQTQIQQRKLKEKHLVDQKVKARKQQLKGEFEMELKRAKQQADGQQRERLRVLQQKEGKVSRQSEQLDRQLENEIKKMKGEMIRLKMREHSQRIKQENDKYKDIYLRQLHALQKDHDSRIASMQTKEPKHTVQLEQLIKECQHQEKEDLQQFNYELQQLKVAKQYQQQEKLQEFKSKAQEQHKRMLHDIIRDYDHIYQKYHSIKRQQYDNYIWEVEKKSKEEYLRTLKTVEKRFITEQQIALIQNSEDREMVLEKEQKNRLQSILNNLNWEQKESRRQLEGIKLEIQNMRSQNITLGSKLNDNQSKLYQLIQDKIKHNPPSNLS